MTYVLDISYGDVKEIYGIYQAEELEQAKSDVQEWIDATIESSEGGEVKVIEIEDSSVEFSRGVFVNDNEEGALLQIVKVLDKDFGRK